MPKTQIQADRLAPGHKVVGNHQARRSVVKFIFSGQYWGSWSKNRFLPRGPRFENGSARLVRGFSAVPTVCRGAPLGAYHRSCPRGVTVKVPGSGAPRSTVRADVAFLKKAPQGTDGQSETRSWKPLTRPTRLAKNRNRRGVFSQKCFLASNLRPQAG